MSALFTLEEQQWIQKHYNAFCNRMPQAAEKVANLLPGLTEDEQWGLQYTYGFMPVSDVLSCPVDLIVDFVKHGVMLYHTTPWLNQKAVPTDIFLPFVLFYRINNEAAEPHRQFIYEALHPRIEGKSAQEAALEANYWCGEEATYRSTDDRTLSAAAVLRRGFGRCGEESTLLCSVLRAIGIPARQCYTPRWAHCDDNHAWVEAYIDGKWQYLGACEPEPVLNKGWFTAAASKAMLVYARGFTDGIQGAHTICQTPVYTVLNSLDTYAQTKDITVQLTQNGQPVAGGLVRLELANGAELSPIASLTTDARGEVHFTTGLGDLHVHATDGNVYVEALMDVRNQSALTLDLSHAPLQEAVRTFALRPPASAFAPAPSITAQMQAAHEKRLATCEQLRNEKAARLAAMGNGPEIAAFLAQENFADEDKQALLCTLREKDFVDVTSHCLTDCLKAALPFAQNFPADIFKAYVLCPRVENEQLLPHRQDIHRYFAEKGLHFENGEEVWAYLQEHTTLLDDYDDPALYATPQGILAHGVSTTHNNDVAFVQICRSLGFAARLSPITGEKEVYANNRFVPVGRDANAYGVLCITSATGKPLTYGVQFTVARLMDGVYHTLKSETGVLEGALTFTLPVGDYRVMTMARQIDGSVLCKTYPVHLGSGEIKNLAIELCPDNTLELLKFAPLPKAFLTTAEGNALDVLAAIGPRKGILCFAEPGQEPTEHFFREVMELAETFNSRKLPLFIILSRTEALQDGTLQLLLQAVPGVITAVCPEETYSEVLRKVMGEGDERKPFVLAVDENHRGLFAFANYNVGAALTVLNVFDSLPQ